MSENFLIQILAYFDLEYIDEDSFDQVVFPRYGKNSLEDGSVLGLNKASAIKCLQHLWDHHDSDLQAFLPSFRDALPVICQVYDANLPYVKVSTGETRGVHTVRDFANFANDTIHAVVRLSSLILRNGASPSSAFTPVPAIIAGAGLAQVVRGAVSGVVASAGVAAVAAMPNFARRVLTSLDTMQGRPAQAKNYINLDTRHLSNFEEQRPVPGNNLKPFFETLDGLGDIRDDEWPLVIRLMLKQLGYTLEDGDKLVMDKHTVIIDRSNAYGFHTIAAEDVDAFNKLFSYIQPSLGFGINREYFQHNTSPWEIFVNLYHEQQFPLSVVYVHNADSAHKLGLIITSDGRLTQAHDFGVYAYDEVERMVKKPLGNVVSVPKLVKEQAQQVRELVRNERAPTLVVAADSKIVAAGSEWDLASIEAAAAVTSANMQAEIIHKKHFPNADRRLDELGEVFMTNARLEEILGGTDEITALYREVHIQVGGAIMGDMHQVSQGTLRHATADDKQLAKELAKAGAPGARFSVNPNVWKARRAWDGKDDHTLDTIKNILMSHSQKIISSDDLRETCKELAVIVMGTTNVGMSLAARALLPDVFKSADIPGIEATVLDIVADEVTEQNIQMLDKTTTGADMVRSVNNFHKLEEHARTVKANHYELNFQWLVAVALQLALLNILRFWSLRHKYRGIVADTMAFVYIVLTLNVNPVNPFLFILHMWMKLVRHPKVNKVIEEAIGKLHTLGVDRNAALLKVSELTTRLIKADTRGIRSALTKARAKHDEILKQQVQQFAKIDHKLKELNHFRPDALGVEERSFKARNKQYEQQRG